MHLLDLILISLRTLGKNKLRSGLTVLGVVIGAWPSEPDLAATSNLADLPAYAGAPLLGCLPSGIGRLGREEFLCAARASLGPALGGCWQSPHT